MKTRMVVMAISFKNLKAWTQGEGHAVQFTDIGKQIIELGDETQLWLQLSCICWSPPWLSTTARSKTE